MQVELNFFATHTLKHPGDCHLLGASDDGTVYVEEMYGDGWIAQHALTPDGTQLATVDENSGDSEDLQPLPLPDDLAHSQPGWHTVGLNFAGPRHRGLREPERITDAVQPFSIQDRMTLVSHYHLPTTPPMLLGLAESFVLSEAPLHPPTTYVVCRRVRLAYATPSVCRDADNQPYDYDTTVLYLVQVVDRERELPGLIADHESSLPGTALHRPMDCLIAGDWLIVADGGSEEQAARVHWWQIRRMPMETPEDALKRRLYG